MKFIKWKMLIITCIVCLLPILIGIAVWEDIPDTVAIHFDIHNRPDNYAPKAFAVFGLPLLMVVLQMICCFINDFNAKQHGERKKFEMITKWIIPIMSAVLYIITIGYSLGWDIDIRKAAALIVSAVFIAIGNYMPKFDHIKHYNVDTEKARRINRFIGFETVVMGLLGIVSIFLPPTFTLIWLFLLIPYAIIAVIYGIVVGKGR